MTQEDMAFFWAFLAVSRPRPSWASQPPCGRSIVRTNPPACGLRRCRPQGRKSSWGLAKTRAVIDIGDGQAAIFKMESHNHPSYIEPYQGAATGVGGILRDVFTMGARPIANLNALRFGSPDHPKTRSLIAGVVAGIGGYGNCVGVPTVGGETEFHPSYNGNILSTR